MVVYYNMLYDSILYYNRVYHSIVYHIPWSARPSLGPGLRGLGRMLPVNLSEPA